MRNGIHAWVTAASRDAGRRLLRLTPTGIAAVLTASAIAPIAQPLLDANASALTAALAGQAGAVGANYLTELLVRTVDRLRGGRADGTVISEVALRDALTESLTAGLDRGDTRLAAAMAEVLESIDGMQTALDAAVEASADEVQQALVAGFSTLSVSFEQFSSVQQDLLRRVTAVWNEVRHQRIEQRRLAEETRRSFVTLTSLYRQLTVQDAHPAGERSSAATTSRSATTADDWDLEHAGMCPYRGLAAFDREDAAWFYGRDALTDELVALLAERLDGPSVLALVGASGSGKSSLLRAGLLVALDQGALPVAGASRWPQLLLTPGGQPLTELATQVAWRAGVAAGSVLEDLRADPARLALAARQVLLAETGPVQPAWDGDANEAATPAAVLHRSTSDEPPRLLLVVDQFEEVFTAGADEAERHLFIRALCAASRPPTGGVAPAAVILGVRADFYQHCIRYPELGGVLQDSHVVVGPMDAAAVRDAIQKPAAQAGRRLEPGLADRIITDLGDEPGNLPLLQFTLTQLWEQQADHMLTHQAYGEVGGVKGSLDRFATDVFERLSPSQQARAKRILARMVHTSDETEDARCPVRRADLRPGDWSIVQRLADERLVVTSHDTQGSETAELAHDALIREWAVLRERLAGDRPFRMWHRRLQDALRLWQANGYRTDYLLQGGPLAEAATWLAERPTELSVVEQDFIALSEPHIETPLPGAPRFEKGLIALYTPAVYLWLIAAGLWVAHGGQRAMDEYQGWLSRNPTWPERLDSLQSWLLVDGHHQIDWPILWTLGWGLVLLLVPWLLRRRGMDRVGWALFRVWPAWLRPLRDTAARWQRKRLKRLAATTRRPWHIPFWRHRPRRHRHWLEMALDEPGPALPTTVGTALAAGNHWLDRRYGLDDGICWPHLFPRLPRILRSQFWTVVRILDSLCVKFFWSAIFTVLMFLWACRDVLYGHLPIGAAVVVLLGVAVCRRLLLWIDVYLDLKRSAYEHYRVLLYEAYDQAVPHDGQEVASGILLTSHLLEQLEPPVFSAETLAFPLDLDMIEVAAGWRTLEAPASEGGTMD